MAIIVEEAKDVAAFKDYTAPAAAAPASPPAATAPTPAAKAAAAPVAKAAAAPAATPTVAPVKAAPAAAAIPLAAGDDYFAFPAWGSSLARSPLAAALAEQQHAYVALYGETGMLPTPLPITKKKGTAAA